MAQANCRHSADRTGRQGLQTCRHRPRDYHLGLFASSSYVIPLNVTLIWCIANTTLGLYKAYAVPIITIIGGTVIPIPIFNNWDLHICVKAPILRYFFFLFFLSSKKGKLEVVGEGYGRGYLSEWAGIYAHS